MMTHPLSRYSGKKVRMLLARSAIAAMLCVSSLSTQTTLAGIVTAKTRVIFQAPQREYNLMLANSNDYPILLQTWVDHGTGDPEVSELPYLILPPLVQMQSMAKQNLRIIYNAMPLPSDRESVHWLNLYEVPATKASQQADILVSLAMNTQLKIFYRPAQLQPLSIEDRVAGLSFELLQQDQQWFIQTQNSSPYHVSLINLRLSHAEQQVEAVAQPDMMSYPSSRKRYLLEHALVPNTHYQLKIELLDDQGHIQSFKKANLQTPSAD